MPTIIPIRDLKDTSKISKMCSESNDPIYVTKNGHDDLVVMSMKVFEERMAMNEVYAKLAEAEDDIKNGRVLDAKTSLNKIREKYHV